MSAGKIIDEMKGKYTKVSKDSNNESKCDSNNKSDCVADSQQIYNATPMHNPPNKTRTTKRSADKVVAILSLLSAITDSTRKVRFVTGQVCVCLYTKK